MKVVILAGGLGTRLSEETSLKPKPMVEIGGKPILWHIMKMYSMYGIDDFIICLGYKGYVIKEYFSNYFLHTSDVTFDVCKNKIEIHNNNCEPWRVTLVDTGSDTMTGGRLRRVRNYVKNDDTFCFTYGDGVSDLNIKSLIDFHKSTGTKATLTAVSPPGRYGILSLKGNLVTNFQEKPRGESNRINGGFFVLSPDVMDYIEGDSTSWELEPLEKLTKEGELSAFRHDGFWYAMDTLRDKQVLEKLWQSGEAPWRTWK